MKERPILFSVPMVQAILTGSKTQTRRIFKGSTEHKGPYNPAYVEAHKHSTGWAEICPLGKPGDRLWVREAWCPCVHGSYEPWLRHIKAPKSNHEAFIQYRADNTLPRMGSDYDGFWRPSIHMPRWASRITMEIVSVRVERLNEISEADAKAEGVVGDWRNCTLASPIGSAVYRKGFELLWESIYGPGSFDGRWVWAVEFKVIEEAGL
jgi:hypothetical protein